MVFNYMNKIVKNVLVVLAGIVTGSIVNMALVNVGPHIVPLPEGADISTMEGLRDSMALFSPINFLFPFLAHALGTLVGAFTVAKLVSNHKMRYALGIGVFFLLGGIAAVYQLGGPSWFILTDILLAYIPMAYLGGKLAGADK